MVSRNNTRKARGGGLFDFFTGSKPSVGSNGLTNAQRTQLQINKSKSQSKVSNYLGTPGKFKYTNKERIEQEFRAAIKEMGNLKEARSAVQEVRDKLESALKSQTSRETGAVVITLPVGLAQIFIKALRVFLAFFALFIGLAATVMGQENAVARIVSATLPNTSFNTTKKFYKGARTFTGANATNESPSVVNYK